ncbi:hypothetical protein C8Q76DRAFT_398807 [Earliella scabrosa]|nr:hypothetical protein C8Q76DRAFT_398807 [Earliella scabrosa]
MILLKVVFSTIVRHLSSAISRESGNRHRPLASARPSLIPTQATNFSNMALVVTFALAQWTILSPGIRAQQTNADCVPEYSWMTNSKGQNPCLVYVYLEVPCLGVKVYLRKLDAPTSFYLGPQAQDDCRCNTVAYSLIEACQMCQFNSSTPETIFPWSAFSTNCTDKVTGSYPEDISPGTAIPAWAYLPINITTADLFNVSAAFEHASKDLPDVTATAIPPSTFRTPTRSTAFATTTPDAITSDIPPVSLQPSSESAQSGTPSPVAGVSGSPGSSNTGAIVGGVVGGVLGLLLIGTVAFWLSLRYRHARDRVLKTTTTHGTESSKGEVMPTTVASLFYNPNDPRTFPSPPSYPTALPTSGRYRVVPEI